MEVTDISQLNPGEVQGAFFSTPTTGSEADETCWDWHIDLYPKGVTFKKCMMIGHYMNYELDEVFYDTVRLTVISNSTEARNARISILVYDKQEGIDYIAKSITRTCYFDGSNALQNFNDIVDFSELHDQCHDSKSLRIKITICPLKS
ncbi:hypothetical protein FSP39_012569 [Pinctada imbricata]|uniref:BTBD17 TRAF domain-containing protein n=1 Tax=Pinctada imbricata TaxID=66713 RepID=A0AA88XNF7_PINIB|nr:hypothetical protein FSP39_012569 [Pinctada imbricata]